MGAAMTAWRLGRQAFGPGALAAPATRATSLVRVFALLVAAGLLREQRTQPSGPAGPLAFGCPGALRPAGASRPALAGGSRGQVCGREPQERRWGWGGALGGFAVCLLALPPWLSEPRNLEEAYGLNKRASGPEDARGPAGRPALQPRFRERLQNIQPYQDIIDQVDKNCHGSGGWRREMAQVCLAAKKVRKNGERKPPPPTDLERMAMSLQTSRCAKFAKATLQQKTLWPAPDPKFPEVAFIGRSNVGKSSLLNQISTFGAVAAVSPMPGRTKHVTWYRNRKVRLDVIDMPGYGHADRAKVFGPAALEFVRARTSLRGLYVLIDARQGFKPSDHEWLAELGGDGPMKQVILTKCDLVGRKELIKIASLVRSDLESHRRVEHKLMLVSAVHQSGLHELRCDICQRCGLTG